MHFLNLLSTTLTTLALTTTALTISTQHISPISSPSHPASPLTKRGSIGGLYICTSTGYESPCTYFQVPGMNQCWDLSPRWSGKLKTFSPDKPAHEQDKFSCSLYEGTGCTGKKGEFWYPGSGHLEKADGLGGEEGFGKSLMCRYT